MQLATRLRGRVSLIASGTNVIARSRRAKALRQIANMPSVVTEKFLQELVGLWSNSAWTADPEFLMALVAECKDGTAVLECGSGLSTLLMGKLGRVSILSLESNPEWAEYMKSAARKLDLGNVEIRYAPIAEYGNYSWYGAELHDDYSWDLAVCDGPPESTPGGRVGLLQGLSAASPGARILLDDSHRPSEQAAMAEWESSGLVKLVSSRETFSTLVVL